MAQIARHTLFGTIRLMRRAGFALTATFGMLLMLFVAVGAALGSGEWRENRGEAFAADRPVETEDTRTARKGAPWSQVIGGREFDTVMAVNETAEGNIVFAGLSLAMEGRDETAGLLIHTDRAGSLKARHEIETSEIGRISKIDLDEDGGSRIVHWVGTDLGFARTDAAGRVLWSRRFEPPSDTAWGDVAAGRAGDTLVAIVSGNASGEVRLARLDKDGKILWRQKIDVGMATADLAVAAAGEGGALLALASQEGETGQLVSLRRFDHRGRLAWERDVYRGRTARLADARLDTDRVGLLVAGEPAGLFVYDTFGTPVWVRELTPLNEHGRHVLARHAGIGYQVIGEPRHAGHAGDIWLARYGEDGREVWTRSRVNRTNSSFEDIHVSSDGTIIAGGSLTDPLAGNTDMLMMRLTAEGEFPTGYDSMATEAPLFAGLATAPASTDATPSENSNAVHAVASSRLPVLAASVIVDEVVAEADRQAALPDHLPEPSEIAVREVAATVPVAAVAVSVAPAAESDAPDRADAAGSGEEAAPASDAETAKQVATSPSPESRDPQEAPVRMAAATVPEPVARLRSRRPAPPVIDETGEAPAFAYRCTFTCIAKGEDSVKYPVDRVIRDVSEDNAGLVALDVLAMDNGVCLASGGVVFDAPRLPPVCSRID